MGCTPQGAASPIQHLCLQTATLGFCVDGQAYLTGVLRTTRPQPFARVRARRSSPCGPCPVVLRSRATALGSGHVTVGEAQLVTALALIQLGARVGYRVLRTWRDPTHVVTNTLGLGALDRQAKACGARSVVGVLLSQLRCTFGTATCVCTYCCVSCVARRRARPRERGAGLGGEYVRRRGR